MNTTGLTTWASIRQKCGLPERKFGALRKTIVEHAKCYTSSIEREEHVWEEMLDPFINSGIGIRFWGPGTKEIWSFPENNVEIRNFLYIMARHSVKTLSTGHRKPSRRSKRTLSSRPCATLAELDINSKNESAATSIMGTCPEPIVPKKQLGFILETNRVGSSEITLIHSAHVPTLAHLVEKICKKDGLEEHQILGIDVKMGDRLFNVGLDDRRDWVYISKLIMESGSGAELVFWI